MRKSHTLNLGTGLFVVLGFAALFFLTTPNHQPRTVLHQPPHYDVSAKFDNIGRPQGGRSGVHVRSGGGPGREHRL